MSKRLLICESPGKIKKLKIILGSDWEVKASFGHVVELANDGDDSLGFSLDSQHNRIECRYTPRGTRGKQVLKELRSAVKQASEIFLATDPDREGETIAWHLAQQLHLKNPCRVTYTEITEKAIKSAIANPRRLDLSLVAAGRCRDTLDKLVGFRGSPLLWKLGNGAKSMGRVQSATLHLLCQREREIQSFAPQDYWSVFVDYAEEFRAYYMGTVAIPDVEMETDTSNDAIESLNKQIESVKVLSQQQPDQILAQARSNLHQVIKVDVKAENREPPAPFTTSSLQQAAGLRLKFGSEKTMKLAQTLYEQGYITYMRTDSVTLAEDYCTEARQWLQQHDYQNVPECVAAQRSKAGAQEAHEAIRPSHVEHTPDSLSTKLSEEENLLYSLIWKRTIASQCKPAQLQKTRVITQSGTAYWQVRGQVMVFKGYTVYWNNISGDSQLPSVQQGLALTLFQAGYEKKQSSPPPRYSEPKLVQIMEMRGIGRPSTYAPTVKTLRDREYVDLLKGHLQPTKLGMEVDEFLGRVLPDLIQSEFTAAMETELDAIASGKQNWERYLLHWNEKYFAPALAAAYHFMGASLEVTSHNSSQAEVTDTHCPKCDRLMHKIPCRSNKLRADRFLKCPNQHCGAAMFWSEKQQIYQLPYSEQKKFPQSGTGEALRTIGTPVLKVGKGTSLPQKRNCTSPQKASTSSAITEHLCPVCSKPLELYDYVKDSQQKQMLRCSDALARRQDDHKEAVYFSSRNVFWSAKYGEIKNYGNSGKKV